MLDMLLNRQIKRASNPENAEESKRFILFIDLPIGSQNPDENQDQNNKNGGLNHISKMAKEGWCLLYY